MPIIFFCPQCGREISVRSAAAGREGHCVNCGEKIVIPDLKPIDPRLLPGSDGDSGPDTPNSESDEDIGIGQ
jgi:DNA-directed RNA polymerase subunit RPC12/RpoP